MTVLRTHVDTTSETYISNYKGNLELIAEHDEWLAVARAGGGERYNARHRSRGKLLPRERIELLLDRDSPFLELTPLAAWGTDFTVGGSRLTGIGVVSGVECVIICDEATIRGGTTNPYTLKRNLRALEIARSNRLPVIHLADTGGADLPTPADPFVLAGQTLPTLTSL